MTAISDLSLEIPKYGIYVLLGSNGYVERILIRHVLKSELIFSAGKSTTMSILGNLLGRTRGSVKFEGNIDRPPRGTIGIVPQKNVLFPELTCYQTLRVWRAIKTPDLRAGEDDDIEQLLKDCDLGKKIHYNADALSGGQKRKLQLAIGLIGGSKSKTRIISCASRLLISLSLSVVLVDEVGMTYTPMTLPHGFILVYFWCGPSFATVNLENIIFSQT